MEKSIIVRCCLILQKLKISPIMRFERGLPMKNKRMRYISITAAILLVFVLLMLLFSNRSGDFSAMEAQDGVLDATSADFSSAVYEIDGEWAFYPEVLGSGAELNTAQPGERNESIPYGSYRLQIHAQPKQYLTLGGYSFDYSTRVLVNGSEVLEIGKVGASAAESEPRIDYMLIPIYTGEDGTVEVVCQYANFVHREGGGLTQMHLSTAENIDRMRRSQNLYSLVLGGSLCLFGMYFLLFAVFRGESKYVFLAVICALLGLRDQNFYVLHLLPASYNWAVAYRFLVLMITLQPCFLLLLLQSLYEKLAKPIVVRCYAALYAVLAAAHFILPTQDIAPLSKIGYYLSMPLFLYLVVQLIRRFWRIRRFEWDDVLVLLGYLLLFGSNVYEAVFGRIVTTITRHGAAPPYLLVFVFLIAGAISLKINRREQELSESRRQREVLTQHNRLESDSGDGIALWGNPEMLLQVLINLTVNANRYTENGVIAYRIADEGERVCLRVSDTGSGIAPDLLPHIFEKGCSGDGGSGIGLTICADAMRIHHGSLKVEHTDADGTVFRLELPKKPLKTQGENDCGR